MVGFEVWFNGTKKTTASIGDSGILLAILRWVEAEELPDGNNYVEVCGQIDVPKQWIEWFTHPLVPGDEVLIRVIHVSEMDLPRNG